MALQYLDVHGTLLYLRDAEALRPLSFTLGPHDALVFYTGRPDRALRRIDRHGLLALRRRRARGMATLTTLCDCLLCEAGPPIVIGDITLISIRPTQPAEGP